MSTPVKHVEPGTRLRVIQQFSASQMRSLGNSAWAMDRNVFAVGAIIIYKGSRQGWGSDPAVEFLVQTADGTVLVAEEGWSMFRLRPGNGFVELA